MTTGMLLGKFMPPHNGHLYLARFAQNYVDDLTIVVGTLKDEPIPGELRHQWMTELFPDANVVHLAEELPQHPDEHPDFWQLWHDALMSVLPHKPDYVFAGEDYGAPLAKALGAEFIPSNMGRGIIPTSGTDIRTHPFENWDYIPDIVRPYFVKRVCIVGPESTGKTTLAEKLADYFETVNVPEYAYTLISQNKKQNKELCLNDIEKIAHAQLSSENALARQANKVLICDTNMKTTEIWSETLFQTCPNWISEKAKQQKYDLYLLMDTDADWVDDLHRVNPETQVEHMRTWEDFLEQGQTPYQKLSGSWDEKFERAKECVQAALI